MDKDAFLLYAKTHLGEDVQWGLDGLGGSIFVEARIGTVNDDGTIVPASRMVLAPLLVQEAMPGYRCGLDASTKSVNLLIVGKRRTPFAWCRKIFAGFGCGLHLWGQGELAKNIAAARECSEEEYPRVVVPMVKTVIGIPNDVVVQLTPEQARYVLDEWLPINISMAHKQVLRCLAVSRKEHEALLALDQWWQSKSA